MPQTTCSEAGGFVTLRGGTVATLAALRLLWSLEDRAFTLQPVGDRLRVQPVERLTAADVAAIRRYRDELLILVAYCDSPPEVM